MTVVVLVFSSGIAATLAQEPQFVALAQRVSVASLDPAFPAVPLARWLAQRGAVRQDSIRWEVNDCGEGGDGRTAPTCVEAAFDLAAGATAYVSLMLADRDKASVKPTIYALFAVSGNSVTRFKNLREWVAHVGLHRR